MPRSGRCGAAGRLPADAPVADPTRPVPPDLAHERERPLRSAGSGSASITWRASGRRPPDRGELRRGTTRAAGEVPGDRGRVGRVARHQPLQAVRLRRRELDALERLSVVHGGPRGRGRRPPIGRAVGLEQLPQARRAPAGSASSPCRAASPAAGRSPVASAPRDRRARSPSVPPPASTPARRRSPRVPMPPPRRPPGPGPGPPLRSPPHRPPAGPGPALGSSESRSPGSDARIGRRPAARSRSTARLRAIARSQVPSDATPGSNSSARFHSARNVSCTTSSAMPRSPVSRMRHGMNATHVPVVERREGILRAAGDGTDEHHLVVGDAALCHPVRAPPGSGFGAAAALTGSGRPSKPVLNTTSVSVVNTCSVVWTWRTTSPRWAMSRARILSR